MCVSVAHFSAKNEKRERSSNCIGAMLPSLRVVASYVNRQVGSQTTRLHPSTAFVLGGHRRYVPVRWHGHGHSHSHGGDPETPGEYSERDAPIYQFGNRDWG